jgi:hypothetical protein
MIITLESVRIRTTQPFPFHEESAKVVECDFCKKRAKGYGADAGEAAEMARREGFMLVRGRKLTDPMKWACNIDHTKET